MMKAPCNACRRRVSPRGPRSRQMISVSLLCHVMLSLLSPAASQLCTPVRHNTWEGLQHAIAISHDFAILCPFHISHAGCPVEDTSLEVSSANLYVMCDSVSQSVEQGTDCVIDCPGTHFTVLENAALTLDGISLVGSKMSAVKVKPNGSLTTYNAVFSNNSKESGSGGAIDAAEGTDLNLVYSHFENNRAQNGGAVYHLGAAIIAHCNFIGNEAKSGGGGALFSGPFALTELNDNVFAGNRATFFAPAVFDGSNANTNGEDNSACNNAVGNTVLCNGISRIQNGVVSCEQFKDECVPPTAAPTTSRPSESPSIMPSSFRSVAPSTAPRGVPSQRPSLRPSAQPTVTRAPWPSPSKRPSLRPSRAPSNAPSTQPSAAPSGMPSIVPSNEHPSRSPSASPSYAPSFGQPSRSPNAIPSSAPSSGNPSSAPSLRASSAPSIMPMATPSRAPSGNPSNETTSTPSAMPSRSLTVSKIPAAAPSAAPTKSPSTSASVSPSGSPTHSLTATPTAPSSTPPPATPTAALTQSPAAPLTKFPTAPPTALPTRSPSASPTGFSSDPPTGLPTKAPSNAPTGSPTVTSIFPLSATPSSFPTAFPTENPSESVPGRIPTSISNDDVHPQCRLKVPRERLLCLLRAQAALTVRYQEWVPAATQVKSLATPHL